LKKGQIDEFPRSKKQLNIENVTVVEELKNEQPVTDILEP